jgi:DNA-binding NtrC family response regulator
MRGTVLIIDDDPSMGDALQSTMARRGFAPSVFSDARSALDALAAEDFDAVVADLNMPQTDGLDVCRRAKLARPDLPVILITAFGSLETAVQAIRAGAYDFVTKPLEPDNLAMVLDRAVSLHRLRREVTRLRDQVAVPGADELRGESLAARTLRESIARVASTNASVLVQGETGSGKELVARALHRLSERASGPFVGINCAALPEPLLESEVFGHAQGAYTDARSSRRGLFLQASGGTLFLDEIGDMPVTLQSKILRAIEERRVRSVGSDQETAFDARIIAATHQDLEAAVAEGRFRQDLLYRLDVIRIDVPPLRARGNDVLMLAQGFIVDAAERMKRSVKGMGSAVAAALLRYSWPGNVRELRNCIERAVAVTRYAELAPEDLPEKIRSPADGSRLPSPGVEDQLLPLDEVERLYIFRVLAAVGGNRTMAAEILCIDRKTLHRKLDRWKT